MIAPDTLRQLFLIGKDSKISDFSYICKGVMGTPQYLTRKFEAMQYFIRSVKYFFYFSFLTTAIVLALVLIGAVEGDINNIFEGGYSSLWKIAAFFVVVAAIYPKFGFFTRKLDTDAGWPVVKDKAKEYFQAKPFILETESDDRLTFRRRDIIGRITKMCEDRITVMRTDDGYTMEGLRKDVILYASGLEQSIFAASDKAE